jgi:hypothetical protein
MEIVELVEQLKTKFFEVREFHANSNIYLLLDCANPVGRDDPLHLQELLAREVQRENVRIGGSSERDDVDWQPMLWPIFRAGESGYADEQLIELSLYSAVDRCASVNGAYVAGWIASDLWLSALAAHILRSGKIFDTHQGRSRDICVYEPHRMALLVDDDASQAFLSSYLSPIHYWGFVDVAGQLREIQGLVPTDGTARSDRHLPLSQCRSQARVSTARLALLGARKAEITIPPNAERSIDLILAEAERQGLTDAEDKIFFALNSLSVSTQWHTHPEAQKLIRLSAVEGRPLASLFSEMPEALLDEIGRVESNRS